MFPCCSWPFSRPNVRDVSFSMRGLSNHHLSCCVNAMLQTLCATWELTDLLDRWESSGARAPGHNVPLQLKRVLSSMRSSTPQPVYHQNFLHCLEHNCIQMNVQHDADELFLSVLNLIQQQMDDKALALEIQNLYKVSVEMHLQCLECTSDKTQISFLLSLPLHIRDEYNTLEDCMASYFEHQELRGRNCCYCRQCGTKTPSKQGVKLLSLPSILRIQLKRFRNNASATQKLNCKVTFPETFDFSEIVNDAFSSEFAQRDCRYTLFAVVVHSGHAKEGHYTAFVRHIVNQCWYYTDDSHVKQTSWEEVKTAYGGGYRHTAYMLMYRRVSEAGGHQAENSA
ncbi:ubl carboxyl-terminal hydrolase 18 isoform X2 [Cheilinus undulatus]|uniref:ubl carboxyl-terminal hydrolase 18 isoform X2 n=1 Tax=Cheilinus undulatus TaxID=241271 RepID=UPI001BD361DA|nr:ubl carboxyl-terminal hydrolase 18 isoform X2 [Cheilinus undulatus]XP_041636970.1 ubl carboxyl-terminal hydrolase 18 isoform X2 [Cheilinus undulatus]